MTYPSKSVQIASAMPPTLSRLASVDFPPVAACGTYLCNGHFLLCLVLRPTLQLRARPSAPSGKRVSWMAERHARREYPLLQQPPVFKTLGRQQGRVLQCRRAMGRRHRKLMLFEKQLLKRLPILLLLAVLYWIARPPWHLREFRVLKPGGRACKRYLPSRCLLVFEGKRI